MNSVRSAKFEDMAVAAGIMVTSFRTAFASFVSLETMDACTNPDNCRAMLESIHREGKMHFLMGDDQGFLCWQETEDGAEIVAIHSLPESWGTGLGHALLTEALKQIGDRPVYLWAFKENTRARRFYEKHGFHWAGTERVSEFDGALEMRYERVIMENKFLCLMAGYDDDTENHLAQIQKKLYAVGLTGQHTKDIPQHITLQTYPTDQEADVVRLVEQIAAETEVFDVCFSHIGIFTGGKVLFIAPDKDTDLIALKEKFGPSFDWTPHTTMLIDEPENIQKALPLVVKEFSSFNGKVTSLHLYEFWPTRHILSVDLR